MLRLGVTRLEPTAGGQHQSQSTYTYTFEHEQGPAVLLNYAAVQFARGASSMPNQNSPTRYSAVAQTFHWLIAALIVNQFVLGLWADNLPNGIHRLALLARHKSFGMTVLTLAILRLLWRLKNAPPELPSSMTPLGQLLARTTHIAFYVLLFAMPITGWLMSSAKNYSVSWFGLFTWPNLIGKNETAFSVLRSTHHLLSDVLFAIAVLHILAALKHHFWNKDDVLLRMLPFTKSGKRS